LTNYQCGPGDYLCCRGQQHEIKRLFDAGVEAHGREGLIKKWRGFGVKLGYLRLRELAVPAFDLEEYKAAIKRQQQGWETEA